MKSVGVRELRQRASEFLRRVERGEVIEITDRERAVAVLVPPPEGSPLERLRASGDIQRGAGNFDDLPEPLVLPRRRAPFGRAEPYAPPRALTWRFISTPRPS